MWKYPNSFFKHNDLHNLDVGGYPIEQSWWSRKYEYPWAITHMEAGLVVADMGCGWHERPLKHALGDLAGHLYCVDSHPEVTKLPLPQNAEFIVSDMSSTPIPETSLDRVFCISVLEETGEGGVEKCLKEFKRVIKPAGLIVLTFDVWYDRERPIGKYPGVDIASFYFMTHDLGLEFVGGLDFGIADALFHEEFNLACYHCVLKNENS